MAKFIKIVSYECPKKGCDYQYIPGASFGEKPPAIGLFNRDTRRQNKNAHLSGFMACPNHGKGLVRRAKKVPIEK